MSISCIHDKKLLETFLRKNIERHFYELGDLDEFFWQHTVWYATMTGEQINQLALFYTGLDVPVIMAFAEEPVDTFQELMRAILPLLPHRLYVHISTGYMRLFHQMYTIEPHGTYQQMALVNREAAFDVDVSETERLSMEDTGKLQQLYRQSYDENWFDPHMLETGQYYGVRMDSRIVCVAGVHVFSKKLRVAAIGSVTTHPDYRCRGLARKASARLVRELWPHVDHIGLNVRCDNQAAIACYQALGFEAVGLYDEFMLESHQAQSNTSNQGSRVEPGSPL